jgi:hypothetical protein
MTAEEEAAWEADRKTQKSFDIANGAEASIGGAWWVECDG